MCLPRTPLFSTIDIMVFFFYSINKDIRMKQRNIDFNINLECNDGKIIQLENVNCRVIFKKIEKLNPNLSRTFCFLENIINYLVEKMISQNLKSEIFTLREPMNKSNWCRLELTKLN